MLYFSTSDIAFGKVFGELFFWYSFSLVCYWMYNPYSIRYIFTNLRLRFFGRTETECIFVTEMCCTHLAPCFFGMFVTE